MLLRKGYGVRKLAASKLACAFAAILCCETKAAASSPYFHAFPDAPPAHAGFRLFDDRLFIFIRGAKAGANLNVLPAIDLDDFAGDMSRFFRA